MEAENETQRIAISMIFALAATVDATRPLHLRTFEEGQPVCGYNGRGIKPLEERKSVSSVTPVSYMISGKSVFPIQY